MPADQTIFDVARREAKDPELVEKALDTLRLIAGHDRIGTECYVCGAPHTYLLSDEAALVLVLLEDYAADLEEEVYNTTSDAEHDPDYDY